MGLGNPLESVVHHLLIEEMDGLDYRDEFPIMSALVCMTTYWTGLTVSYDLKLSSSHYLIVRIKILKIWYDVIDLEFVIYLMIFRFYFYLFWFHVLYFISILV